MRSASAAARYFSWIEMIIAAATTVSKNFTPEIEESRFRIEVFDAQKNAILPLFRQIIYLTKLSVQIFSYSIR